jgi:hypothetical protein
MNPEYKKDWYLREREREQGEIRISLFSIRDTSLSISLPHKCHPLRTIVYEKIKDQNISFSLPKW